MFSFSSGSCHRSGGSCLWCPLLKQTVLSLPLKRKRMHSLGGQEVQQRLRVPGRLCSGLVPAACVGPGRSKTCRKAHLCQPRTRWVSSRSSPNPTVPRGLPYMSGQFQAGGGGEAERDRRREGSPVCGVAQEGGGVRILPQAPNQANHPQSRLFGLASAF